MLGKKNIFFKISPHQSARGSYNPKFLSIIIHKTFSGKVSSPIYEWRFTSSSPSFAGS